MRRLTLVAALILAAVLITAVPVVAAPLAAPLATLEVSLTGEKDRIRLSGAPRGK
jgi:hypothetical protein